MNEPVVTVCVPVYNTARYIKQCVNSVFDQDFKDWSLLVADNCSTDGTWEILQGLSHPQMRLFRHQRNIGGIANLNSLLERAETEFVCFVGSDDYLYPNHLSNKVRLLEQNPEAPFAYGPADLIDEAGKPFRSRPPADSAPDIENNREFLARMLRGNSVMFPSVVFRRAALKTYGITFDSRLRYLIDWHVYVELALYHDCFVRDPTTTLAYRIHPASDTRCHGEGFEWAMESYEHFKSSFEEHPREWVQLGFDVGAESKRLTLWLWVVAFKEWRRGNGENARKAWRAFRRFHGLGSIVRNLPAYVCGALSKRILEERMKLRSTIYTGAASYVQIASVVVTQLISIPLALSFLSQEQFGLWTFTLQSLGYLLLMDFGVTSSVGRLMADPLHKGNQAEEWNRWYSLFLVILVLQAVAILVVGLVVVEAVLRWFHIPAALHDEARRLWVMMLFINAFTFPFRLYPGLLAAQNRSYWALLSSGAGLWAGLGAFYVFLKLGFHSLAYGYSWLACMLVASLAPWYAVLKGPHRFQFSLGHIPWRHAREVFGFSSAIFVVGIAVQIVFLSQSLIITKLVGLSAVAAFTVCSRVPMLLMQLIWRPFDAFNPRWQINWCRDEQAPLREEFRQSVRLTIGLALTAASCCLAGNRWFVNIFAHHHGLYIGKWFDVWFAIFFVVQVWNHCLGYIFVLTKKLKRFSLVICLDTALGLGVCILATQRFGLMGYVAATAIYLLLSVAFWYISLAGPVKLGMSLKELTRGALGSWGVLVGVFAVGAVSLLPAYARQSSALLWLEICLFTVAPLMFLWLYRNDLDRYLAALRKPGRPVNEALSTNET